MILDIHVSFALALVYLTVLSIFIWQELNNFNSLIRLYFIYATFKNPFLLSYTFIVILKMSTWHKFNPLSRSLIWGTGMVICLFSLFFLLKINFFSYNIFQLFPPTHTHTPHSCSPSSLTDPVPSGPSLAKKRLPRDNHQTWQNK